VGFGGRRAGSDDRLRSVLVDELEEGQDGMARSTLGVEPARAVAEGRARHVRVDPGAAFGELPQEQGCADRAAVTLSGVLTLFSSAASSSMSGMRQKLSPARFALSVIAWASASLPVKKAE
jgi:hypothetical protein